MELQAESGFLPESPYTLCSQEGQPPLLVQKRDLLSLLQEKRGSPVFRFSQTQVGENPPAVAVNGCFRIPEPGLLRKSDEQAIFVPNPEMDVPGFSAPAAETFHFFPGDQADEIGWFVHEHSLYPFGEIYSRSGFFGMGLTGPVEFI
jgi:hypothetical protein